jgi:hypothetical protein
MRKYVFLKEKVNEICKVMIFDTTDEIYVFLYDTLEDTACLQIIASRVCKKQKSIARILELRMRTGVILMSRWKNVRTI